MMAMKLADAKRKEPVLVGRMWQIQEVAHNVFNNFEECLNESYTWINEVIAEAKKTLATYVKYFFIIQFL